MTSLWTESIHTAQRRATTRPALFTHSDMSNEAVDDFPSTPRGDETPPRALVPRALCRHEQRDHAIHGRRASTRIVTIARTLTRTTPATQLHPG